MADASCMMPVIESELERLIPSRDVAAFYRKNYPQTTKSVGRARRDVVDFARFCGFSGQMLCDIEVAVGEGLANAVEHGCGEHCDFEVSVRQDFASLVVEIKDSGIGFDHNVVGARDRPGHDALRGFGTLIMRELMDEVRYTDYGTRLQLSKRLPTSAPVTLRASAH